MFFTCPAVTWVFRTPSARLSRRVAVHEYGLRMIMCSRQRSMITIEGRDEQLAEAAGGGLLARAVLARFRRDFHACLTARADELSELADAVLCAHGPVRSLAGLSLVPEHRRGHGALYDAVNGGRIEIARLRRALAGLPLPRAADGRLMLAVDVSNWLRPGRGHQPGQVVLSRVWPREGAGADDPGLAVLGGGGAGAGRTCPGPRCWMPSAWAQRMTRPR